MSATPRRPLTIEDLWALRRPGPPTANGDGSVILFPVTAYDLEANEGKTRLYRVSLSGGEPKPLTALDVSSTEPALSPDGTRVAFVRKAAGGKGQLAVLPLDGGEAEVLTDFALGICDPRWFPDGTRIAFLGWVYADAPTPEGTKKRREEREKDPVQVRVTESRLYRYWDGWLTEGIVPHLFVIDLARRDIRDLLPDSRRWFDLMDPSGHYDISPDGKEIAFSANSSQPPHRQLNWDVFVVSTDGGEPQNLTPGNPGDDLRPRYSPDGTHILYGMQRKRDFYADRVRLVAYERAGGRHRVLTEAWDRSAMGWEFIPGTDEIRWVAEEDGRHAVFGGTLAMTEPRLLGRGGSFEGLRPLADGSLLAVASTLSRPPELVRLPAGGGEPVRIAPLNEALIDQLDLGEVREIRYPGAEGHEIQAFVVLPPGFDPKRRWPLVEMLHGGPHAMTADQFHYRWNLHLLAAPGYVVLAPNFHGSTGRGQDFAECIQGGWGDKPFTDAMAGVDALLAQGYIDERRMAAVGASYGGYLVSWIAGHTDRFACIVNHAGVGDTLAEYASDVTFDWGAALGGEPWTELAGIDRMNPIRFAKGFNTPMLITHGERDFRVPVDQGLQLYNVLQAKGVPCRLVVFPDENHWILKPQNSRFWVREFHGWLARWIGPSAGGNPDPGRGY